MPLPKAKEYALEFVRGLRRGQRTTDPAAHLNRLSIQEEPDEGTPNPELMEEAPEPQPKPTGNSSRGHRQRRRRGGAHADSWR